SRLIWYGEDKIVDPRIINLPASLPEHRISNFSHMGLIFAPENHYYGKNGIQLICDNGQSEENELKCPTDENRWYSSFDHVEDGKIHARLTWNPYFEHLENTTKMVVGSNE
ncbi:MAG: alpha/beta hydrolase, partial [Pseudomonadota bacterium]